MTPARPPVLVAYATGHGSTRGVVERVTARLREHGEDVDLRPVDELSDPGSAAAVVLGQSAHLRVILRP